MANLHVCHLQQSTITYLHMRGKGHGCQNSQESRICMQDMRATDIEGVKNHVFAYGDGGLER